MSVRSQVIGGVCFRPFFTQGFAEIVFLAITNTEQVSPTPSSICTPTPHTASYPSTVAWPTVLLPCCSCVPKVKGYGTRLMNHLKEHVKV